MCVLQVEWGGSVSAQVQVRLQVSNPQQGGDLSQLCIRDSVSGVTLLQTNSSVQERGFQTFSTDSLRGTNSTPEKHSRIDIIAIIAEKTHTHNVENKHILTVCVMCVCCVVLCVCVCVCSWLSVCGFVQDERERKQRADSQSPSVSDLLQRHSGILIHSCVCVSVCLSLAVCVSVCHSLCMLGCVCVCVCVCV